MSILLSKFNVFNNHHFSSKNRSVKTISLQCAAAHSFTAFRVLRHIGSPEKARYISAPRLSFFSQQYIVPSLRKVQEQLLIKTAQTEITHQRLCCSYILYNIILHLSRIYARFFLKLAIFCSKNGFPDVLRHIGYTIYNIIIKHCLICHILIIYQEHFSAISPNMQDFKFFLAFSLTFSSTNGKIMTLSEFCRQQYFRRKKNELQRRRCADPVGLCHHRFHQP